MSKDKTQPLDYKQWLREYKGLTLAQVKTIPYDNGNTDREYLRYLEEWYSDYDLNREEA